MEDCTNWKYALGKGTILRGDSYVYEIKAVLGHGTFGITYLATVRLKGALGELSGGMQVAIKEFFMRNINGRQGTTVLTGSEGGLYEEYKRKFRREAVNLSKLSHPSIVKVLESFEANNTVYYVMEYVDGGSLDKYIAEKGGLDEKEALARARQIGGALAFMHARGMLHLDLKPGNVMRSADGRMILIDFGLAKQYDENGEPESSTDVGGGTPGYAPVEQANYHEGKDFPVTMDVYALGATLYKMLTGERPPEASEVLNEGLDTEKLRTRGVTEHVIACVEKAMAPTRKQRYQSVGEFLEALTGEALEEMEEDVRHEEKDKTVIDEKKIEKEVNEEEERGSDYAVRFVGYLATLVVIGILLSRWVAHNFSYMNDWYYAVGIPTVLTTGLAFSHVRLLKKKRWLWLLFLVPFSHLVRLQFASVTFSWWMIWLAELAAYGVIVRFAPQLEAWLIKDRRWLWVVTLLPLSFLVCGLILHLKNVMFVIFEIVPALVIVPLASRINDWVLRLMFVGCAIFTVMALVL